jgi:putative heme-binding domain-containing protein
VGGEGSNSLPDPARFEGKGNGLGPDLTTLGKRFKREDILTAIYYPSRDINDQYRSVVVELHSGLVLSGMQGPPGPDQLVLLLSDGTTRKVRKGEVAEIRPSKVSIMPEGGLDVYGPDEIADLLAFLEFGEEKPPSRP